MNTQAPKTSFEKPEATPGPWTVAPNDGGPFTLVRAGDQMTGRRIADTFCSHARQKSPETYLAGIRENEANARLIAAAPDLLEALRCLVDEFGGSIEQYHKIGPDFTHKDGTETLFASTLLDREELIERARAAIAKAEGAQS
jgi:hypothetical protein